MTAPETKSRAIEELARAANAMQTAVNALRDIEDDPKMNLYIGPDASYYRAQIEELLSCDDGEAGLTALIDLLVKRNEG